MVPERCSPGGEHSWSDQPQEGDCDHGDRFLFEGEDFFFEVFLTASTPHHKVVSAAAISAFVHVPPLATFQAQ